MTQGKCTFNTTASNVGDSNHHGGNPKWQAALDFGSARVGEHEWAQHQPPGVDKVEERLADRVLSHGGHQVDAPRVERDVDVEEVERLVPHRLHHGQDEVYQHCDI